MKTYCEFSFDAAHSVAPYSGCTAIRSWQSLPSAARLDPDYGWPVNLYEVEKFIAEVKGNHHRAGARPLESRRIPEVGVASLENVTKYLWRVFKARFPTSRRSS